MIGTSAKGTDWIVGGKLFKKATLFSNCKQYCIISAYKTVKDSTFQKPLLQLFLNSVQMSGKTVI